MIRSTWDYAERPDAFRAWLDELDAAGNTVVNPTALLRWNMHKGYLAELAARGVSVVPTAMVPAGSDTSLAAVMEAHGWTQVVVQTGHRCVSPPDVPSRPIDGHVTHAVAKRPASGEWRVQSEYGGSVTPVSVTEQHERVVAQVLDAVNRMPAYARVDLVPIEGELHLMELELIEPELFFELAPQAADRLADLLVSG